MHEYKCCGTCLGKVSLDGVGMCPSTASEVTLPKKVST